MKKLLLMLMILAGVVGSGWGAEKNWLGTAGTDSTRTLWDPNTARAATDSCVFATGSGWDTINAAATAAAVNMTSGYTGSIYMKANYTIATGTSPAPLQMQATQGIYGSAGNFLLSFTNGSTLNATQGNMNFPNTIGYIDIEKTTGAGTLTVTGSGKWNFGANTVYFVSRSNTTNKWYLPSFTATGSFYTGGVSAGNVQITKWGGGVDTIGTFAGSQYNRNTAIDSLDSATIYISTTFITGALHGLEASKSKLIFYGGTNGQFNADSSKRFNRITIAKTGVSNIQQSSYTLAGAIRCSTMTISSGTLYSVLHCDTLKGFGKSVFFPETSYVKNFVDCNKMLVSVTAGKSLKFDNINCTDPLNRISFFSGTTGTAWKAYTGTAKRFSNVIFQDATFNMRDTLDGTGLSMGKNIGLVTLSSNYNTIKITPDTSSNGDVVYVWLKSGGWTATGGDSVWFDGTLLDSIVRVDYWLLRGKVPAHAGGSVTVKLKNGDNDSISIANGFYYNADKTIQTWNSSGSTAFDSAVNYTPGHAGLLTTSDDVVFNTASAVNATVPTGHTVNIGSLTVSGYTGKITNAADSVAVNGSVIMNFGSGGTIDWRGALDMRKSGRLIINRKLDSLSRVYMRGSGQYSVADSSKSIGYLNVAYPGHISYVGKAYSAGNQMPTAQFYLHGGYHSSDTFVCWYNAQGSNWFKADSGTVFKGTRIFYPYRSYQDDSTKPFNIPAYLSDSMTVDSTASTASGFGTTKMSGTQTLYYNQTGPVSSTGKYWLLDNVSTAPQIYDTKNYRMNLRGVVALNNENAGHDSSDNIINFGSASHYIGDIKYYTATTKWVANFQSSIDTFAGSFDIHDRSLVNAGTSEQVFSSIYPATFTTRGQTYNRISFNSDFVDTVTGNLVANRLKIKAGSKVYFKNSPAYGGSVGALDTIISSLSGAKDTIQLYARAVVNYAYVKDQFVTGDSMICTTGCVDGGNNVGVLFPSIVYPPGPLSYSPSSWRDTVGSADLGHDITNGGGACDSFRISPALPAGLTLDSTTGAISGTPTAVSPATVYTVTGYNATGTASTTITIKVIGTTLQIDAISPAYGTPKGGTTVMFLGFHFGATQGSGSVFIGDTADTIISWNDTVIVAVTKPYAAGAVLALVTNNTADDATIPFTYRVAGSNADPLGGDAYRQPAYRNTRKTWR